MSYINHYNKYGWMDYFSYIVCCLTGIIIVVYLYIRLKYGFWATQPVFHYYDISYRMLPPGIIDDSLPSKNKYTNFTNITTYSFDNLTSLQKQRFLHLLTVHDKCKREHIFSLKEANVLSYFNGLVRQSFVSFYYKDHHMMDAKTGDIVADKHMVGSITTRPVKVYIKDARTRFKEESTFMAYYMDFLCVDGLREKAGECIAFQLIQTHYYNQRVLNKKIVVSILRKEGRENLLFGIVPLCKYVIYSFPVDAIGLRATAIPANYTILEINTHNFRYLFDFVKLHQGQFDVTIKNDVSNLIELVKTNTVYIYAVFVDNGIQGCYFFRKGANASLACFASICNCDESIFINGFKISFWKIVSKNKCTFLNIENISHNSILIHDIVHIKNINPIETKEVAYYFYNFAYPSFPSSKCFILH